MNECELVYKYKRVKIKIIPKYTKKQTKKEQKINICHCQNKTNVKNDGILIVND